MRRRAIRGALAGLAISLAIGAFAAPSTAQEGPTTTTAPPKAGTTGTPDTPSGDPAIDDLVGCVQGSRRLLVLFLIDESASLKVSDPEDRRVDAAQGALDSLVALSSGQGGASPQVDVALAAFSNEYRLVQDWTPAGADTADELNSSLEEFADFKDGIDTDFVNALSAARESLADQSAEITADGGEPPCRAVMLFTDGGYDLAVRTSSEAQDRLGATKEYGAGIELTNKANVEAVERLGRQALCDPGGLADQLRSDEVTLLTVALSGDVARRSQLPLAAATTGIADDYPCGTQPEDGESTRAPGAYLPAEDIDVLVTQFTGLGSRLAGGNLVPGSDEVEVCGDDACEQGSRTWKLDSTLRRAQILSLAPKAGTEVELKGPTGKTTRISKAGTSDLGGTPVVARVLAGRGLSIELDRPKDLGSWTGEWTATIVDPSGDQEGDTATLQVYVFSDIGVAFAKQTPLVRGAATELEAVLRLPKGVDPKDVVATGTATARLHDPVTGKTTTVDLEGPPAGPYKGTFTTPADTTSNAMEATAEVRITTTSDAALVSQSGRSELLVRRPEGSIQFVPASLSMPSLTGKGTTETGMILIGGDAPGCVWFGKVDVPDPPEGMGDLVVTQDGSALPTEASCIKVAADQQVNIQIEAEPSDRASGTVAGNLQVFEKRDGQEEASTTEVPFRFDLSRGVDQARRLLLSIALLAAGLGLPMLLLLLINALTARFQDLDVVRGTAMPVRVSGRSISRLDDEFPRKLSLRDSDFGSLAGTGNDRKFTFGGVEFRARASRNPFGATIALAAPEGGAEKLKGKAGSKVELDPGLAGSWVFLLDPDQTRYARGDAEGLLIAFVSEGDVRRQMDRMLADIEARLPGTAERLAGLVLQNRSKASKAPKAEKPPKKAKGGKGDPAELVDDQVDGKVRPVTPTTPPPAAPAPAPVEEDVIDVESEELTDLTPPPAPEPEVDEAPVEAEEPPSTAMPMGSGEPEEAAPAMPMPASTGDDDDRGAMEMGPGDEPDR